MYQVDEKPETIHLYVIREDVARPSLLPVFLSIVALLCVVVVGVFSPYKQPVTRAVLRVPAVLLIPKSFSVSEPIIPTGSKTIPATIAHGYLTITNGSVIVQIIPKGFTVDGVATDSVVFVPAGSANGYGVATVSAHALVSGTDGNLLTLAINQVEGSSVYVRNLSPFTGGHDSYSVKFVTLQDRQTALEHTRQKLLQQSISLHYPCKETSHILGSNLGLTLVCQFVSYHIPAFYHVTGVRFSGKNLFISVWFVVRPVRIEPK